MCMHMHVHASLCSNVTNVHVHMFMCVYTHMYVYIHIHKHTYMYRCTYAVCMYVCMYVHPRQTCSGIYTPKGNFFGGLLTSPTQGSGVRRGLEPHAICRKGPRLRPFDVSIAYTRDLLSLNLKPPIGISEAYTIESSEVSGCFYKSGVVS